MDNRTFAEFYNDYRGRVITDTVLFTVLRLILQGIGLFGNISIAVVTIQHKQFQSASGIMLAAAAVSDSLHQTSHDYFAYLMFTGINFTSLKHCVYFNTLPLVGETSGMLFTLFIGVDRALATLCPTWHRKQKTSHFLGLYFSLCAAYNGFFTTAQFVETFKDPDRDTICLISDAQPGYTGPLWFQLCLVFNLLTVVCYLVVYVGIRTNSASRANQKMFVSLAAITAVVFCGWVSNAAGHVVFDFLKLTPVQAWYAGFYLGITINIAVVSNYFLLFALSKDYRTAFKAHLYLLCGRFGTKHALTDVSIKPLSHPKNSTITDRRRGQL